MEFFDCLEMWTRLESVLADLVKADKPVFGACVCMMLEEWCKENNADAVEFASELAGHVATVNAELGKYV